MMLFSQIDVTQIAQYVGYVMITIAAVSGIAFVFWFVFKRENNGLSARQATSWKGISEAMEVSSKQLELKITELKTELTEVKDELRKVIRRNERNDTEIDNLRTENENLRVDNARLKALVEKQ